MDPNSDLIASETFAEVNIIDFKLTVFGIGFFFEENFSSLIFFNRLFPPFQHIFPNFWILSFHFF